MTEVNNTTMQSNVRSTLWTEWNSWESNLSLIGKISESKFILDDKRITSLTLPLFSSSCQRQRELLPSLGVRCLLAKWTETWYVCKVFYKDCSFRPNAFTNMVATGTFVILVSDWSISKKSSPLKPLGQMYWNLVGSIYGRSGSSIKIAHLSQSLNKHGHHRQFLFLIGPFLNKSSPLNPLGQMNRNLVQRIYGKSFIKIDIFYYFGLIR